MWVYSGDDERFEYIYKFVTSGTVSANDRQANMNLLDDAPFTWRSTMRTAPASGWR